MTWEEYRDEVAWSLLHVLEANDYEGDMGARTFAYEDAIEGRDG